MRYSRMILQEFLDQKVIKIKAELIPKIIGNGDNCRCLQCYFNSIFRYRMTKLQIPFVSSPGTPLCFTSVAALSPATGKPRLKLKNDVPADAVPEAWPSPAIKIAPDRMSCQIN